MKLLIINATPVFPLVTGGRIRTAQLARQLAKLGLEVTILTPYHFTQQAALYKDEPFKIHQLKYPFVLPYLFTDKPFPYSYLASFHPGYNNLAQRLLDQYDIYQFESPEFASLIDQIPADKLVVYNAHNVQYHYSTSETANKWIKRITGKKIYRLEEKLVKRAAHIFACCQRDRDQFRALYQVPDSKTSLALNGIEQITPPTDTSEQMFSHFPELKNFPHRALFSGSNVEHNRVAVRFIIEELAPKLEKEWAFIIQGSCGLNFKQVNESNIFFDLENDHFEDYVTGTIGLNPITQGSGSNLKLLYYLTHGMPVVSTQFGIRGYEELKPNVKISDTEGFAAILKADKFIDPPAPADLYERYSWAKVANHIYQTYQELTKKA